MSELHPINRCLLVILENQVARTKAALCDLPEDLYDAAPGGDCKSIRAIGAHLILLRRFQLTLLDSPLADRVAEPNSATNPKDLLRALEEAAELVRQAITAHDPEDWLALPDPPRDGKWGEDPTLLRVTRPLNDFVNHLGAIRAIRRIHGKPADRTQ